MKKSDLYEIAVKLLGLYLFFISLGLLRDVYSAAAFLVQEQQFAEIRRNFGLWLLLILEVAHFVFVVLLASLLTFGTRAIVKLICKPADYQENIGPIADRKVIYEIVLVVTGLLLIVWTLPDFAFKLKNYLQTGGDDLLVINADKNFIASSVIKIVVGLAAVLYAGRLSSLLVRTKQKPKNN